ncbi:MAG: heavy metal-binding domain-containing protein [Thiolinea sp.]
MKNLFGGELKGYTELLQESREEAMQRMIQQAEAIGANGCSNVRFFNLQRGPGRSGNLRLRHCGDSGVTPMSFELWYILVLLVLAYFIGSHWKNATTVRSSPREHEYNSLPAVSVRTPARPFSA